MRVLNGALCALLILFTAVQYNDPDAPLWIAIYGLAAIWAGIAAFRTGVLRGSTARFLLAASAAAAAYGVVYYWPHTPHWWWREVWWQTETAREGMGMMIVLASMLLVGVTALTARARA